jgi:hypothetical protein
MFHLKWREMLEAFHHLNPDGWDEPASKAPFIKFAPISPIRPSFIKDGIGLVHFLVDAKFPELVASATDVITDEECTSNDSVRLLAGNGMAEAFMRIAFPRNGKYTVEVYAGSEPGGSCHPLSEVGSGAYAWRFDVEGAPSNDRPLASLLADRKFGKLPMPRGLQLDPSDWCVKLSDLVYKCRCTYQGERLSIEGRSLNGDGSERFRPDAMSKLPDRGAQSVVGATITCPREGVWQLVFFIDGDRFLTQYVMTGSASPLPLTPGEADTINAGLG